MKQLAKIVVGVDFGKPSEIALAQAIRLARAHSASLTVLNVSEPYPGEEAWPAVLTVKWGEIRESIYSARLLELEQLLEKFDTEGLEITARVVFGSTSLKLAALAKTEEADLLVVAASGKSPIERTLLGSTAESLIKQASTPIWVARSEEEQNLRRIVVAVDYSKAAVDAVETAALLARTYGAEINLIHAFRDPADRLFAVASEEEQQRYQQLVVTAARKEFDAFVDEHTPADLDHLVTSTLTSGKPWRELTKQAEVTDADLIVVGSRSESYLRQMVLGSTATQITRHAKCSVLVVHPPA